MTGKDRQDHDIDQYLSGEDGLSNAYHNAATESPSDATDDAVLAASRRAVGSRPGRRVVIPGSGYGPAAIAAIIILSVIVVVNLPDEQLRNYDDYGPMKTFPLEVTEEADINTAIRGESVLQETAPDIEMSAEAVRQPETPVFADDMQSFRALSREIAEEPPIPAEQEAGMRPAPSIINEARDSAAATGRLEVPASPQAGDGDPAASRESTGNLEDIVVTARRSGSFIECPEPRPEACTMEYLPVCALRDTGIRCVTTPCDSTEELEYSNACSACADSDVIGYNEGVCEPGSGED